MRSDITGAENWVIKVGSAVFLDESNRLDRRAFVQLVKDVADLIDRGKAVTIISSGAVALGREKLGWPDPERQDIPYLQALAATGQSRLMAMYETEFGFYDRTVSQVLFTRGDLSNHHRFLNARMTLSELHNQNITPVINENDTVATEELKFGDNDKLAGMTCGVVDADILVLLSTVDGIYDVEDPDAEEPTFTSVIESIEADSKKLDRIAKPTESNVGTGGMASKVEAARIAGRLGVPTVVANGKTDNILDALADGESVGTYLEPMESEGLQGKKKWLGVGAEAVGKIICDPGARRAIEEQGASLLPSGVEEVDGGFKEGDVIELADSETHSRFARGLAVYGADEIARIKGRQSSEIEETLGYKILDSVVHRDSLVIL